MSLNEEKDDEDPNNLPVPQNLQDEIVHTISTSLRNIAVQLNNLNKHTEGVLGELSEEVNKVSSRYYTLHERVSQLNDQIISKTTNKGTKSKALQSTSIQTDQVSSNPLPIKIRETHDVSVQTSPPHTIIPCWQNDPEVLTVPYYKDNTRRLMTHYKNRAQDMMPYCIDSAQGLVISPDISYHFEICKEKFIPIIKEQNQEKLKQKNKCLNQVSESEIVPQIPLIENIGAAAHIPSDCVAVSHSRADLPTFSTYPFRELGKVLTKAVGKVLSSSPHAQKNEVLDLRMSSPYVSYGIGKGEVKPQPQVKNRPKIEVFVSPTAPASPPPLPSDWLTALRDSKKGTSAPKIHSQTQFPSPDFGTLATFLPECLPTPSETDISTTEPVEDFFDFPPPPAEFYEEDPNDLFPQEEENGETPPIAPCPVVSRRIETNDTASDLFDSTFFPQSPASFVFPSEWPSLTKTPMSSASKSARPSVLSTPRCSQQPPTSYISSPLLKSSKAAVSGHSILHTFKNSDPLPGSPYSQASRSPFLSSRCSSTQSIKSSVALKHLDVQSSRTSIASAENLCVEHSTGHLFSPQQTSSGLKLTKPFTLQSLFSFPQSTSSSSSSPRTLSVFQYSEDSVHPDPKQSPSVSPVFNKARNALMDSIRKGVLLRKTEERCILKAQIAISKDGDNSITIHHKSIGCNSGKMKKKDN